MEEEPASSASSSEQAATTQEAKAGDNSEDTLMEVVDKVGSSGKQQEQAEAAEHAEARASDSTKEDDDDDGGAAAVETEATESESTALADAQQTEPTQLESQQQQQQQQQPQQAEPTAASAAAAEAVPAGDEAEAVTVTPVKRPKSAYFHFMMKHRLKFKQDNPGLKLGPLQKLIGAKWQSMSDDDKAPYHKAAAEDRERYNKHIEAQKASGIVPQKRGVVRKDAPVQDIMPLSRVKKILKCDPDAPNFTKEAILLLRRASEEFVKLMGREAAKTTHRKTLTPLDLAAATKRCRPLKFLQPDFGHVSEPEATSRPRGKSKGQGKGKGKAAAAAGGGTRDLASFFG